MEIREAQKLIKEKFFERDHSRGLFATFAWFVEEVGELSRAILCMDPENIEEEVADVLAWLLSLANLLGVDVEEAFRAKYLSRPGS